MSCGSARALGRDGVGDLAGGALERGHDAGRGVVGHPGLRAGGGDGQRTRRIRYGHREAAHTDLLLALDRDITLILIEHDMDVALRVAERVTMMHDGRVIVEGTPDEIRGNQLVHDLYLGSTEMLEEQAR